MSFGGDQGQTIRQLMNANLLKRVVMCCMSSGPSGKRQHLAVAQEKGKLTVLQLSALLRQADSPQKKLTLTRLSSAPIPFAVISVASNSVNEDYLAVAGLKDCHVLAFSSSGKTFKCRSPPTFPPLKGTLSGHIVLHPQLDANNFIVKTLWMPGSDTQLALVTADFVKVYDLAVDALSPQYYFLVPSGKVHDCTLAFFPDGSRVVLIMSSAGHIYYQPLQDESSARHGPFYVTNIMDVCHPDLEDSSEQIGGGGVSIFYYHALRLLFFSYANAGNFAASLPDISSADNLRNVHKLEIKTSNSTAASSSSKSSPSSVRHQPLCQWREVGHHPGLITAFLQVSNNPVVISVQPQTVLAQEIRVTAGGGGAQQQQQQPQQNAPSSSVGKAAKVVDVVAIRHSVASSSEPLRTTLILLCEDGSLRIYVANPATEYWLSGELGVTQQEEANGECTELDHI